jgi:hypothetical protein
MGELGYVARSLVRAAAFRVMTRAPLWAARRLGCRLAPRAHAMSLFGRRVSEFLARLR